MQPAIQRYLHGLLSGAGDGTRTCDLRITKDTLKGRERFSEAVRQDLSATHLPPICHLTGFSAFGNLFCRGCILGDRICPCVSLLFGNKVIEFVHLVPLVYLVEVGVYLQCGVYVGVACLFVCGEDIHTCLIEHSDICVPEPVGGDVCDRALEFFVLLFFIDNVFLMCDFVW